MNPTSPFPAVPPPVPPKPSNPGKWVLIGCGGCLGLIVIGAALSVGIYFFTMSIIQKSGVYEQAFKRVQESAEVREALGTQIEAGWTFSGSVNYTNDSGTANFTQPVTGPKGEGSLRVKASKASGSDWQYEMLEVALPDGRRVDLRGP